MACPGGHNNWASCVLHAASGEVKEAGSAGGTAVAGDGVRARADARLGALRGRAAGQVTPARRTSSSSRQTVRAEATHGAVRVSRQLIGRRLVRTCHVL